MQHKQFDWIATQNFLIRSVFLDIETELPASFPTPKMNKIQSQVQSKNSLDHSLVLPTIHCKSKSLKEFSSIQYQVRHPTVNAGEYCWLQDVLEFSIGMAVQLENVYFLTDRLTQCFAQLQRPLQLQNLHLSLSKHPSDRQQWLGFLIQFPV